jgi:hypothetical protein
MHCGRLGCAVPGLWKRRRDLPLVEPRAVITLDQQRYPTAPGQMPRPAECGIEAIAFLEQHSFDIQRSNRR